MTIEKTYINGEGYEDAVFRNNYTRDSIAEAVRLMAEIYASTSNPAAAVALSKRQELAVERYGYTWEEVENIELDAYKLRS